MTFAPDGHVSRFSRSWLAANAPGKAEVFDDRSERHRPPWLAADLGGHPPEVAWPDLSTDGAFRTTALRDLMHSGVLLVRDVPSTPGIVLAVANSFAHVRVTNYGDLFDVRVEAQPVNLAFTGRAIAPHTDNPYRDPVPGIQLLHCRQSSAEDANTLLRASAPIITLNAAGDVRAIRWNDRSIQPPSVPPQNIAEIYRALRVFATILDRPELHLHVTLEPGDCIVFDNTRILHARTAFEGGSGARHLQGCYADLDGLASTVAVLERRVDERV